MLRKIILLVFILIALLVLAVVIAALLIDPDDYRDELAARASQQLGREVRLEGPMDLRFFPWLALDIRDVTVGNPPGFEQAPPLAGIERATAAVRVLPLLRGELEVGAVTIERAGLHLVTAAGGASNLEGLFAEPAAPTEGGRPIDLSGLQTGPVRFENVVLSIIDLSARSRTDLRLDSLQLDPFRPGQDVDLALSGRLVEAGETQIEFDFDGVVRVAADLARVSLSDWNLNYVFPAADARGGASGSLSLDLAARPMRLSFDELRTELVSGETTLTLDAGRSLDVSLGEEVRVALPAARFGLNGQALDLEGEATLGELVRGRLAVRGERLDLTGLGSGGATAGEPAEPDSGSEADFSALTMLDLSFSLDLDQLVLADGVTLSGVSARSVLRDGELTLDPLQARLFGGSFDGSARVDFNQAPPEVVVTPNLSGIRVAELASLLTGQSPVDGEGEFRMDVRFRGFSPEAMLRSLDGSGTYAIAEGVLHGVDLEALIDEELTTSNLGSISRAFGGETRFRTLGGGLQIHDGVVELPNLDLAAAGYGATGQGRIDLGAGRVDYALVLDLGEELTERLPGALRRATGGRIPLGISGDLTRPTVSVDLAALAEGAVRQELGRRLLESLGDDKDEEPDPQPQPEGETATGDAGADEASSERDQRRDAARNLLRGLLESREEEPESESEKESDQETESDPPGHVGQERRT